jgi:hypothetical protein
MLLQQRLLLFLKGQLKNTELITLKQLKNLYVTWYYVSNNKGHTSPNPWITQHMNHMQNVLYSLKHKTLLSLTSRATKPLSRRTTSGTGAVPQIGSRS